jgi:glycerol kinase
VSAPGGSGGVVPPRQTPRAGVVLAVDQGSSSSRCVALDLAGRPLALASRPVATALPQPGWVEHDAGELLASAAGAMGDALARAGAAWSDVAAIGLAAQTETFVVWERGSGRPVYPAISWRDSRSAGLCARLRRAGHEAEIRERTGLPLEPAFSAAKLAWLLDEVGGARRRAEAGELLFGDVNSWLTWNLSGGAAHVTEPSMAARSMLFNLGTLDWDPALLALFGIPAAMLPAVRPTSGTLAVTDPGACGGRAVIGASIGDQQAALFGQRCWRAGLAKLTLGTGAFLWCHAGPVPPASVPSGVVSSCAWMRPGDTAYALEGFVPNAGGITTWLRRLGVVADGSWPAIRDGAAAEAARRGADRGTWCVPAIFGLGTPRWGSAPRADIVGLTAGSEAADVAEAALLGVAHQVADAIDAVGAGIGGPLAVIRVDGGMSRNDSLLRAIADLAGVVLERPAAAEVTALGAGTLAGLGTGLWDLAALEAVPFPVGEPVRPALAPDARAAVRGAWQTVLDRSVSAAGGPS